MVNGSEQPELAELRGAWVGPAAVAVVAAAVVAAGVVSVKGLGCSGLARAGGESVCGGSPVYSIRAMVASRVRSSEFRPVLSSTAACPLAGRVVTLKLRNLCDPRLHV